MGTEFVGFDSFVGRLLDFLEVQKPRDKGSSHVPLEFFRGAQPLVPQAATVAGDAAFLVPPDATPLDLDDPLDVAVISNPSAEIPNWTLSRLRQAPRSVLRRNRVPAVYYGRNGRTLAEMTFAVVPMSGDYTAGRRHVAFVAGRWVAATSEYVGVTSTFVRHGTPLDDKMASIARALTGVQFTQSLYWSVDLGHGRTSVRFITDPSGAMEAFRLRDIPPGAKRRAALRNWVEQHWRKRRDGGLTEVRRHLRGATEFSWNGLYCKITPCRADLERNQRAVG